MVGFGPKSRYLGASAKTQEISNLKNTVSSLSRLAGRSLKDPDVQIEQEFVTAPLVDINGQVGAEVTYMGSKQQFTATQLVSMFLTKVKATAAAELRLPVNDIVLSCPVWYTDAQRRALIDAAEIAGLKPLRLINEPTAVALGYGITKTDLPGPDEKPRRVAFVDIGHSNYTCSIVEFKKGELAVKSAACDRHFGGRNIDKVITEHFITEFKEKFKINIAENGKAKTRLMTAVEKLKKILSANAQAPLNVESIMNDVDVRGMLKRDELEELIKPLIDRLQVPLKQALDDAKLKVEDIDSIEMVGASTRVPAFKAGVQKFFGGKQLSYTLNQDEAVARGCAFACAILSPVFRVRDFSIHDIIQYPIEFTWEKSADIPDEDTSLTVFNKGGVMPSTKILTFYRKQPFDLEARYSKPEVLPGKVNPWIGRFSVKGVKADGKDEFMICKLKARVNHHGILNLEQGYYVEEQEVEEPVPEEKKEGEVSDSIDDLSPTPSAAITGKRAVSPQPVLADTTTKKTKLTAHDSQSTEADKANGTADKAPPKMRKVKKQVRGGELPLSAGTASMDQASKDQSMEKENQMFMEDKLVADTEEKKNDLESLIYELRDKIDTTYSEFANEAEKDKLRTKLTETEDWLYDDGDDASKAVYVSKIDDIKSISGPIVQRYMDKVEEERQAILKAQEEEAAKKQAEADAKKKAEEEAKAAQNDTTMSDAPADGSAQQPDSVEEPDS